FSVGRHARLVDYALHDGCNARAWVQVRMKEGADHVLPKGTPLLTRDGDLPVPLPPASKELREAPGACGTVFERAHDIDLSFTLRRLSLYTGGDLGCCLPRGATRATLVGDHPKLKPNAVLVFQEVRSPTTFKEEDADRAKRWAVRLTDVKAG